MIRLAIVSPCYNEEEVLEDSASTLLQTLDKLVDAQKIAPDSFIVYVNDGSFDGTWDLIQKLHRKDRRVKGVNLSFNSGHQQAIMAGMMSVKNCVDAAITIDADLQDDINAIEIMVDKFLDGYDVVYGVKTSRKADGFVKRFTAKTFYKVQKSMGVNAVYNHADFRLVSNKVLNALSAYKESALYLRGIIASMGFKSATVDDVISERKAGESKYSGRKMMRLATDGITSFSSRPLKIIAWIGVLFLIVAIINAVDIVIALVNGTANPGWSQLMLSIWFVGGMIMISLGLVGIYIGRIYAEAKRRPGYIIADKIE